MNTYLPGPIYSVGSDFLREFRKEFPEYRIRWSLKKHCWHIEQRCGRGALSPIHVDAMDDGLIRARDGYWLVMEIQPGDRMACPRCHSTINVPICKFGETRCTYCIVQRRDGRVTAGYMPCNSILLEHLRRTDPLRGATQRLAKEADVANQKRLDAAQRATSNAIEAASKDAFARLVGIPQFGYTGANKNIHLSKEIT